MDAMPKADSKKLKTRKCRVCRASYTPIRPLQSACGTACALALAQTMRERDAARAAREDRKQTRAQLEAMKTIPQLLKEAQHAFNRFIRLRDRGRNCISTGRPLPLDGIGGAYDAGHYRSVGSAPHLRFNEYNCHGQTKYANQYLAGDAQAYRIGLIARIGLERVEALEANNDTHKWTRDEVRAIRDTYRARAKQLERKD